MANINKLIPQMTPLQRGRRNTERNVAFIDNPFVRPKWGATSSVITERGRTHRSATVDDLLDFVWLGIRTYQGYWQHLGSDPYVVWFPFAPDIEKGETIYCERPTESTDPKARKEVLVYTVKALMRNEGINVVKLDGNSAPQTGDIMKLDESKGKTIDFRIGYPNSEDVNYYFDEETLKHEAEQPWRDCVTYRVLRTEPAGVRDLFGEPKEYVPRRIETKYEDVQNRNVEYRAQHFDSEIQFDCWGKTNEDAEALASWFRYFMTLYTPIFRENGVIQIVFLGKRQDIHVTRWRSDIVARSVRYGIRTQEVTAYDVGIIHALRATLAAGWEDANQESVSFVVDDVPDPSNEFSTPIPHY